MTKWNVIMVITIVMIAAMGEAKQIRQTTWIGCFRYCSRNCSDTDGYCYEGCKIKCGGPTPTQIYSRNSYGNNPSYTEDKEVRGKKN
ncbi:unnamed protein product [Eruca vesicaria subsp. sativa]|uniref:Uncharacterized protein n=1 Tax=Eruca vesicaria subsp. sativa TaxID=29727 RepID=A0ABC8L627_ERUVS|nr:unnamed protein product [Eruca vesicaria subsp. sativa]